MNPRAMRVLANESPLLVEVPTLIESHRLFMRPPQAGDGGVLLPAWVESRMELRKYLSMLPWVGREQTPEVAEAYCRHCHANFMARTDLPYLIFERNAGRLIGFVGLHRPEWSVPKFEVGYWVRSSEVGKGYASEAVEAIARMALDALHAARVEVVTDEENTPSRHVAEVCHFRLEGTLRSETRTLDGGLRNTCIYARYPVAP